MTDLERWINLKGPPPEDIRRLLEAARGLPELTPEMAAEMERSFLRALAAQRRKRARARKAKWALAGLLGASAAAAAAVVALRAGGETREAGATVEAVGVEETATVGGDAGPEPQGADGGATRAPVRLRGR